MVCLYHIELIVGHHLKRDWGDAIRAPIVYLSKSCHIRKQLMNNEGVPYLQYLIYKISGSVFFSHTCKLGFTVSASFFKYILGLFLPVFGEDRKVG